MADRMEERWAPRYEAVYQDAYHLLGEDLGPLNVKELQQLGVGSVCSRTGQAKEGALKPLYEKPSLLVTYRNDANDADQRRASKGMTSIAENSSK
ncbi:hypothetical protein HPP92_004676 [Vanilla planifolia]|uniref:Uncharacterized protein n=1 Tax=Vanilla planifolia TaxID=51239 RepID=A0A835RXY1_VANPL|nr:hypothetical protein HPP92_004676 [Vanilla planifolia]